MSGRYQTMADAAGALRNVFSLLSFKRLCLALCLAGSGPALADPGYYLLTPYSLPGQAALDLRYWSVKPRSGPAMAWPEVGVRYGVSSRWTSELLASFVGPTPSHQRLDTLNWQNMVLLTQGQYAYDLAIHTQLIHRQDGKNVLELGPVFQTEIGLTQLNANLILEHDYASDEGTELKYQWQALHRIDRGVRIGVQGFGEMGRWNRWSNEQSHRAGPVVRLGLGEKLEVQAAYLWGKSYGTRGDMFSAQLLWSF